MTRLVLLASILVLGMVGAACSASRDDRLGSQCLHDDQCGGGGACRNGHCTDVGTSSGLATVTGKVSGAPATVRVTSQSVGDESCSTHKDQGLVCTLTPGGRVVLVAPDVDGYRFTGWSGKGCVGDDNTLELPKVQAATTCVANYARRIRIGGSVADDPGLAVVASSEAKSATCSEGSCEVDVGDVVTLSAPERDGHRIDTFDGAGCGERDGYHVTISAADKDISCVATYVDSLTVRGQATGLASSAMAAVTATSDAASAVCGGGTCGVDSGADVTLSAAEVDGYRFRGWMGDAPCLGNDTVLSIPGVTTNVLCTADYVPRFKVQGASTGPSASLPVTIGAQSDNLFSSCEGSSCVVDQDEDVTLLAGTVDGYRLDSWSGAGCQGLSGNSAIAAKVQANLTCTAHYVKGVAVSGTVVNATGTVDASSTSSGAKCGNGSCSIDVGGAVTLEAPAIAGRTFLGWSGDEGCSSKDTSVTLSDVNTSKSCVATFAARYVATGAPVPSAGGSVAASSRASNSKCSGGTCTVDQGSAVQLDATTNPNFRFTGWSGGGPCTGSNPRITLEDLQSGVTCSANFIARIKVSGVAQPANSATISATQLSLAASCAGASCTVDSGSNVTLNATAAEGYQFTRWSDCGSSFNPLLTVNPLAVIGPTTDTQCTAIFQKIKYIVSAVAGTGGSVSASTAGSSCSGAMCSVEYGGSAVLTATASDGYVFRDWGSCGSASPLTVSNVRMPQSCTASFTKKLVVTAMSVNNAPPSAEGNPFINGTGSITCQGSCTVVPGGSATFLATPASDSFVNSWSCSPGSSSYKLDLSNLTTTTLPLGQARQVSVSNVTSDTVCSVNFWKLWQPAP